MLLVPLLLSPPDFLNLSESCREKAVFVQRHNTSLHSKFRQTALKLTPKGLDYITQIDTLREPCTTDLWFWEVLGQSQSWLRTMQTDLWKLFINSRIFEFLTSCPKLLHMRKNVIVLLWSCVPLGSGSGFLIQDRSDHGVPNERNFGS